ncbi:MAG: glycoside hydrolase family 65 protein, partial [Chitinivibrionales bacterium]|nr:glycoside hydrolase family 65 protein [Chitinivibrionales bacterium]
MRTVSGTVTESSVESHPTTHTSELHPAAGDSQAMSDWSVVYHGWRPQEEGTREALCTLGNGYFATRGAAEESTADDVHYPGTYLAGGYDRAKSEVKNRVIENEDLVNWPNWLPLTFRIEGGQWFSLSNVTVLDYRQELALDKGMLTRTLRVEDRDGHVTSLRSRRFVHISQPHRAAIHWELIPHNWSGPVTLRSSLDGNIENEGVERYRALNGDHIDVLDTGKTQSGILYLRARSHQSRIEMALACRNRILLNGEVVRSEVLPRYSDNAIGIEVSLPVHEGETVEVEKTVAIYTSRDFAITQPLQEAVDSAHASPHFEDLARTHVQTWSRIWHRCDLDTDGLGEQTQLILRLHIFHLMQVATKNILDLDVGVPSRGLHGEAYRGHILWDELFILPYLNFRIPELSREFLMYRYRRLDRARDAAWRAGYDGAMFPWQSGSNGREESQALHLNPASGHWVPDETHLQRHVNAAIAYNVWQYFQATRDIDFIHFFGAELMLEIARFWASVAHYEPKRRRYEIHGVVGPDEYHTRYPGARNAGLRNNAYTNVMVAWVMRRTLDVLDLLSAARRKELMQKLELTSDEIQRWREMAESMYVPI